MFEADLFNTAFTFRFRVDIQTLQLYRVQYPLRGRESIMGIWFYSMLLEMSGQKGKAVSYENKARQLAREWEMEAGAGEHTMLAFGNEESWSLKYNLIWDILFESKLFSEELFEKELDWYIKKQNIWNRLSF